MNTYSKFKNAAIICAIIHAVITNSCQVTLHRSYNILLNTRADTISYQTQGKWTKRGSLHFLDHYSH